MCLPVSAVSTGAGPFQQADNAAGPGRFSQHRCNAAPARYVNGRRGGVAWGALDGSRVCLVSDTSPTLSGWGRVRLADAETHRRGKKK